MGGGGGFRAFAAAAAARVTGSAPHSAPGSPRSMGPGAAAGYQGAGWQHGTAVPGSASYTSLSTLASNASAGRSSHHGGYSHGHGYAASGAAYGGAGSSGNRWHAPGYGAVPGGGGGIPASASNLSLASVSSELSLHSTAAAGGGGGRNLTPEEDGHAMTPHFGYTQQQTPHLQHQQQLHHHAPGAVANSASAAVAAGMDKDAFAGGARGHGADLPVGWPADYGGRPVPAVSGAQGPSGASWLTQHRHQQQHQYEQGSNGLPFH
jgi:hypothetical protein